MKLHWWGKMQRSTVAELAQIRLFGPSECSCFGMDLVWRRSSDFTQVAVFKLWSEVFLLKTNGLQNRTAADVTQKLHLHWRVKLGCKVLSYCTVCCVFIEHTTYWCCKRATRWSLVYYWLLIFLVLRQNHPWKKQNGCHFFFLSSCNKTRIPH